jgi:hypothetical protein
VHAKQALEKLGTVRDVIESMDDTYILAAVPAIDAPIELDKPLRAAMGNYHGFIEIKECEVRND